MRNTFLILAGIAAIGVGFQVAIAKNPHAGAGAAKAKVKYAEVQKILTVSCVRCHGDARPRGGINLTKYEAVMKGGEDGAIVVAGNPKKSVLYLAVAQSTGYRPMPPRGPKLGEKDLKTIESWIKEGAKK
jgi:mono/diheme cytochrome c family protein